MYLTVLEVVIQGVALTEVAESHSHRKVAVTAAVCGPRCRRHRHREEHNSYTQRYKHERHQTLELYAIVHDAAGVLVQLAEIRLNTTIEQPFAKPTIVSMRPSSFC